MACATAHCSPTAELWSILFSSLARTRPRSAHFVLRPRHPLLVGSRATAAAATAARRYSSVVVPHSTAHAFSDAASNVDQAATTSAAAASPAVDFSLFEEESVEYLITSPSQSVQLPNAQRERIASADDLLVTLIRRRDFRGAARIRDELYSLRVPLTPNAIYGAAAHLSLRDGHLVDFLAYSMLLPIYDARGAAEWKATRRLHIHMRRTVERLCHMARASGKKGKDAREALIKWGLTVAAKGYGAMVADKIIAHVVRFSSSEASVWFVTNFAEAHRQFGFSNKAASEAPAMVMASIKGKEKEGPSMTRADYSANLSAPDLNVELQISDWYNIAARSECFCGRPEEAVRWIERLASQPVLADERLQMAWTERRDEMKSRGLRMGVERGTVHIVVEGLLRTKRRSLAERVLQIVASQPKFAFSSSADDDVDLDLNRLEMMALSAPRQRSAAQANLDARIRSLLEEGKLEEGKMLLNVALCTAIRESYMSDRLDLVEANVGIGNREELQNFVPSVHTIATLLHSLFSSPRSGGKHNWSSPRVFLMHIRTRLRRSLRKRLKARRITTGLYEQAELVFLARLGQWAELVRFFHHNFRWTRLSETPVAVSALVGGQHGGMGSPRMAEAAMENRVHAKFQATKYAQDLLLRALVLLCHYDLELLERTYADFLDDAFGDVNGPRGKRQGTFSAATPDALVVPPRLRGDAYMFTHFLRAFPRVFSSRSTPSSTVSGPARVLSVVHDMLSLGVEPTVVTWACVVAAFAKEGKTLETTALLKAMEAEETVDERAFDALCGTQLASSNVEGKESEMRMVSVRLPKPNVITYTSAIQGLTIAGKTDEARDVLRRMMKVHALGASEVEGDERLKHALQYLEKKQQVRERHKTSSAARKRVT